MRSKGSRFTLGVWGLRVCSLNVAQPSTVLARAPWPCLYGEFCKSGHFWKFQTSRGFVSRCRRGTLWHSNMVHKASKVVLCGRRNTFASFPEDESHFPVAGAALWRPPSSFRVAGAALQTVSHCQGCVKWWQHENRVASVGRRESVILHGRGTIRCRSVECGMSFCVAGAIFRTLYTVHFTLHTLHSALYTLHSTLYTLHCTLYTLHFTLHTLHSALYTLHFTLYTPHLTLYTAHSTLYTLHSTLYTLHSTLYTFHSTLYTPHSTPYTWDSTLYTLQSTLHTLHFTVHTLHFTLHTLHSTL